MIDNRELILQVSTTRRLIIQTNKNVVSSIILDDTLRQSSTMIKKGSLVKQIEEKLKKQYNTRSLFISLKNMDILNINQLDRLIGGGNQQTIEKKQNTEVSQKDDIIMLDKKLEELESEINQGLSLEEQSNQISIEQNSYMEKEVKHEELYLLKLKTLKCIEMNFSNLLDQRYYMYTFLNDYRNLFFLTLNKHTDNSYKISNRLRTLKKQIPDDSQGKYIGDVSFLFSQLIKLEVLVSQVQEGYKEKLQVLQQMYEDVYISINYKKPGYSTNKQEFDKKFVEYLKQNQYFYHIDELKENVFTEINYLIECMDNNIQSINQVEILTLLKSNQKRKFFEGSLIWFKIMYFLEINLVSQVENIVINSDNYIVKLFVKNLIAAISQQDSSDNQLQSEFKSKRFLHQFAYNLMILFQKKQQTNSLCYEELQLFIISQEVENNDFLRILEDQFGNNLTLKNNLIKWKFKPEQYSDILEYLEYIKASNKLTSLKIPENIASKNIYSQQLKYLRGDYFQGSENSNELYKQVISYFSTNNSEMKFVFVYSPADSGKTFFVKELIEQVQKSADSQVKAYYLRSKYVGLNKSSIEEILLSDPFNFTVAQTKVFLGEEKVTNLIIIDGFNQTQFKRKQLKKIFNSAKGKNVHFLITTREQDLHQDVFFKYQNYMILELENVYQQQQANSKKKKIAKNPFQLFNDLQIKRLKDNKLDLSRFYYIMSDKTNIMIFNEIKRLDPLKEVFEIVQAIQSKQQLISYFIDLSLDQAIEKNLYPPKDVSDEQIQQNMSQTNLDKSTLKTLTKQYLKALAYTSFLMESEMNDEDFSVSENNLKKFLDSDSLQQLEQISRIVELSNLIQKYSEWDSLQSDSNLTVFVSFKHSNVFIHFLGQAFIQDIENQNLSKLLNSEEQLRNLRLCQKPLLKQPVTQFQIDILEVIFDCIKNYCQVIPENQEKVIPQIHDQLQDGEDNQEQNNVVKEVKERNEDELLEQGDDKKEINEDNKEEKEEEENKENEVQENFQNLEGREGIEQINTFFTRFLFKYQNNNNDQLKIGVSNIKAAFQRSNMCKFDIKDIPDLFSQINIMYYNQVTDNLAVLGYDYSPKELISFNNDKNNFLFFLKSKSILKYEIYEDKYSFKSELTFNQKCNYIPQLKKSQENLFCNIYPHSIHKINPNTLEYTALKMEGADCGDFSCAFDVSSCEKYIATFDSDSNKLMIWEVDSQLQKLVFKHMLEFEMKINFIKFSKDPNIINLLSYYDLLVLNISETISNKKEKKEEENEGESNNQSESYTYLLKQSRSSKFQWADENDEYLATVNNDGYLRLFNKNEKYKMYEEQLHNDWIRHVVFSQCGRFLLTSSDDQTYCIFDVKKLQFISFYRGGSNYVMYGAFIGKNNFIATACYQTNSIRIFNVPQNTEGYIINPDSNATLKHYEIESDIFSSNCLSFSQEESNSQQFASGSPNGNVYIWKFQQYKKDRVVVTEAVNCLEGHKLEVLCVAYSPDNQILASCSNDRNIFIWRVSSYQKIETDMMEHDEAVTCLAFSPDSKQLASGGWDQTIKIWKITDQQKEYYITQLDELFHARGVLCVAYSPSGEYLVSGSTSKTVQIWRTKDYNSVLQVINFNDFVYDATFTQDSKHLLCSSKDKTIKIFDTNTFSQKLSIQSNQQVSQIKLTKNDHLLISGTIQSSLIFYYLNDSLNQYKQIYSESYDEPISSIQVSKNKKYIVSGYGKQINVSQTKNYSPNTLKARHTVEISYVNFLNNGILVSIDISGRLNMWDSQNSFKKIATLDLEKSGSNNKEKYKATFSYNNEYFATFNDISCSVWDKSLKPINCQVNQSKHSITTQYYFSPNGTYLVAVDSSDSIIQVFTKQDNFTSAVEVDINKKPQNEYSSEQNNLFDNQDGNQEIQNSNEHVNEQNDEQDMSKYLMSQEQYLEEYEQNKEKIPFIYYLASDNYIQSRYSIQLQKIKQITFSSDESKMYYMIVNPYSYNNTFKCFNVTQNFQMMEVNNNHNEEQAKIVMDIFFKNKSYEERLTKEQYFQYYQTLITLPYTLYYNSSYTSQDYHAVASISYDSKYFAILSKDNSILIWNIYEQLREYTEEEVEEKQVQQVDEEGNDQQNQDSNRVSQNNEDGIIIDHDQDQQNQNNIEDIKDQQQGDEQELHSEIKEEQKLNQIIIQPQKQLTSEESQELINNQEQKNQQDDKKEDSAQELNAENDLEGQSSQLQEQILDNNNQQENNKIVSVIQEKPKKINILFDKKYISDTLHPNYVI